MFELIEGHKFSLDNFENPGTDGQVLQFIQKEPTEPGSVDLKTVHNGTTNEEVLAMLIRRLYYLNKKFPCRENSIVITKLEESLMWLNKRTADRKARFVEGKYLA